MLSFLTIHLYTVPVKGIAALHAHYTQRPRSVHAPYTQIHKDVCNYTHVVTRSGRDFACKITHSRPTGTH